MSFGIEAKKLKTLIDFYHPENSGQELKYMVHLKGQEELFRNLETCPFQGITANSIEDRELTFGRNRLPKRNQPIVNILARSFNQPCIYAPILIAIFLAVQRTFSKLGGRVQQCFILMIVGLMNWFLRALQELYLCYKWAESDAEMSEQLCIVVRQNKREKIMSSQLTVGDIVQFKEGETIPADGWLIEGFDITVTEKYLSQLVEVEKDTLKKCIMDIKIAVQKNPAFNEKIVDLDQVKSKKSPVLLSGSTVKSGEGRMVVLCVGKHSRRGEFLALSRQKQGENILKNKLEGLMSRTFNYLLAFVLVYTFLFIAFNVEKGVVGHTVSKLLTFKEWINLQEGFIVLALGVPLGLKLALLAGFFSIKMRLWLAQGIWVGYCQHVCKMAAVTQVCYDKEKNWEKVQYRQWWNQQKGSFRRDGGEGTFDKEEGERTEESCIEDAESSENFKELMTLSLSFKNSQHPKQHYIISPYATLKKNPLNEWHVFQQEVDGQQVRYFCEGNIIKYVTMHQAGKGGELTFIKGQASDILRICTEMMMKSTGQQQALNGELRDQVKEVIQSMNRRLATTQAVCYGTCEDGTLQAQIQAIREGKLVLLCLLGMSNTKDHSDYEMVRKLRTAGINLILVSSKGHLQSISRSKCIGVNTLQEDNLTLQGTDFIKIVGGVICFNCKKSYCACENQEDNDPRLKNIEEFRRITKYFKVMSTATYFEKYALMVGYRNVRRFTAYMGIQSEDNPAQTNSNLPINSTLSNAHLPNSEVTFPSNSLRSLYNFINWSRFSCHFARKFIQLLLPASLVPSIIMFFSGLFFGVNPFTIAQLLWVSVVLCGATGINLSWQRPQQSDMQEGGDNFGLDSPVLIEPVKKQAVSQCIFQSIMLIVMLAIGHQFLPEAADKVDNMIGSDWQAKYSTSSLKYVASGLYRNPLLESPSYQRVYQTYGIHSRHLSIVFNTFALMQIFNYFNCRKLGVSQINIIQGIQLQNVLLFFVILAAHIIFMTVALDSSGLYPVGLTIEQWLLSSGLAISVDIVGFVVRLLPDSSQFKPHHRRWANKSYNLSIKLVGKSDKFYEFDREEDALFKFK